MQNDCPKTWSYEQRNGRKSYLLEGKETYVPFEKLKKNLQVDVDELEDLAASQEVKAMPTFAFFKGGKKLESFAGANEARIRETIEKLLAA